MISRFGYSRLELHEALSKCAYNNLMAIYLLLGRYKNEVLIIIISHFNFKNN